MFVTVATALAPLSHHYMEAWLSHHKLCKVLTVVVMINPGVQAAIGVVNSTSNCMQRDVGFKISGSVVTDFAASVGISSPLGIKKSASSVIA